MNLLNGSIGVTDLQIRSTNLQNYRILSHKLKYLLLCSIFLYGTSAFNILSVCQKKVIFLHDLYLCTISDLEAYDANHFFNWTGNFTDMVSKFLFVAALA